MQTIFGRGFEAKVSLGQHGPINYPPFDRTPVPEELPAPPEMPGSIANKIDAATRRDLLDIISASKKKRNNVAAWWASHPDARQILGERLKDYSAYLTESMSYDNLVNTLEWRFTQGGEYVHDWEIADLRKYQAATDNLVAVVEGKIPGKGIPDEPETEELVLTGGVALAAFVTAILL